MFDKLTQYLDSESIIYKENVSFKTLSTFKTGGNLSALVIPKTVEEVKSAVKYCKDNLLYTVILGRGSNILAPDEGIEGVGIKFAEEFSDIQVNGNTITAMSGASLTSVSKFALENGLSGLEFAFGIPGNIGGAVYMNAGAYGGEMSFVVSSVTYLDENLEVKIASSSQLDFSYRHSMFCGTEKIILSATFELKNGDKTAIKAKMDENLTARNDKQPVNYPSAGSTFKRPKGGFAAALIDEAGLKGFRIGGAMVSEKHAGFVINYDNASTKDILDIVKAIKEKVYENSGIELEPEIKILKGK